MSFTFIPQTIPDVVLVRSPRFEDARGTFLETFRRSAFSEAGIPDAFVQDNHVWSERGVLRGLHYQLPPAAQGKLVRVARGRIFDVAVDLRPNSPTYGQHAACELDAERGEQLWIPPGFAHGYAVLGDGADVGYKVTSEYAPDRERGIRWDDPTLRIPWPLSDPVLSQKDRELPLMAEADLPGASQ